MFIRTKEGISGWLLAVVPEVTEAHLRLAFGEGEPFGVEGKKSYGPRSWGFREPGGYSFHVYTRDGEVHIGGTSDHPGPFKAWLLTAVSDAIRAAQKREEASLNASLVADLKRDLKFLARGGVPAPGKTREQNIAQIEADIARLQAKG